ncbi:glycosyl hydrolase family 18 protein [uncultured Aquimarina sp.]|uniref:glycosyl hydrolase family 18 protein n=1 Tax=uncultured Aquimarina sp. TaxID=575652 RepID=UPI00260D6374|nr:glycosyl hydrolase family 18 protein [uncultured Aquimarina sp.]
MKKLFFTIFSLTLFISCNTDPKSSNSSVNDVKSMDSVNYISQRHLQNQRFENYNFKTEEQWDSLRTISHKKVLHKKGKVHPDIRTFGWHIYSNGSTYKNYNFSMLWGLSYFSYALQPETGSYKTIHQWKTTSLIDSAKTKGCKVFFSVSNFGKKNNTIFLRNQKARQTLIDSLSSLLALRSADGINIDFEGVSKKDKEHFTKFIIEISKNLKQDNPNYMISLCLYAIDWNDIFDIGVIDPYIDFYTLMGYDYYGSFSKTTGPVTPLKKSKKFGNGLETSVNYYKNKGVHFNKLIVGLPYYGAEWYTKKPEIGAVATRFKSHPKYQSIKELYIDSLKIPVQFDPKSASSYIIIKDSNKVYRQLFFEDVKSLSIKYNWIKSNRIGGVGIWALGYDDGYPELWDLLTEKFSQEQNAP